jgi:hypothetical protein
MTAQIRDKVHYREKSRSLAGKNGAGLFDPAQHGIRPVAISTACYRGYHCTYEVEGGALLLTEVHLGLSEKHKASAARGDGPRLFGKVPRRYTEHGGRMYLPTGEVRTSWESSDFKIDGIREPIPFTGGLVLG